MQPMAPVNNKIAATPPYTDEHSAAIETLITTAHTAQANLYAWEQSLEEKLTATEYFIDTQLHQIKSAVIHFQKTLQTTNAHEWHANTKIIYSEGREHMQSLQETYNEIKKSTKDICIRFDRTSAQITKTLTNTLNQLHPTELQQLADDCRTEIKIATVTATQQITQTLSWFHWKNIGLAFFLATLVVLCTSLYIEDEWPWETHTTVIKQRFAGQMLMTAWPQLSHAIQQQIINDVT